MGWQPVNYLCLTVPDASSLGKVGEVARRCWTGQYQSFDEIVADLRKIGAWEGYVNVGDLATGGSGE